MKLRWQISIIALLSLSFPLVAWYTFSELNQTYQSGMVSASQKQADIIVRSIENHISSQGAAGISGLVAVSITETDAQDDGNFAEWQTMPWYDVDYKLRFKLGRQGMNWRLLIHCQDSSPRMSADGRLDRLIIALGTQQGIKRISIPRQAVGPIQQPNLKAAYWHEQSGGYQVELTLNDIELTRIGLAVFDYDHRPEPLYHGHVEDEQLQLQALFQSQDHWQTFLEEIKPKDGQLRLLDPQNRLLYQTSEPTPQIQDSDWLSQFLYEQIFDQNPNDQSHFYGQQLSHELSIGFLKTSFVQAQSQIILMQTFLRALGWVLLSALILVLVYLLYAAFLAWRIKKLQHGLQAALDDHGSINTELPIATSQDELGELSRGMSQLLERINEYTDYLKQLGNRLSHEMKTPISIVHTSLENLQLNHPEDAFVERALNANNRLKFILNQLSALSRLKQAIGQSEKQKINVSQLCAQLAAAYQSNNPQIETNIISEPLAVQAVPDLLAQMLDKLIHNAETHAKEHDHICLSLSRDDHKAYLQVINTGSQIDEQHKHRLFDSLASFRNNKSDTPHLGLGLYIAQLICDFHQGSIKAENGLYQGREAAIFTITLPLQLN